MKCRGKVWLVFTGTIRVTNEGVSLAPPFLAFHASFRSCTRGFYSTYSSPSTLTRMRGKPVSQVFLIK